MTEILLGVIVFLLCIIIVMLAMIYSMVWKTAFDPLAPTNQYGEGLSEGIQNAIARGQRGITTYD